MSSFRSGRVEAIERSESIPGDGATPRTPRWLLLCIVRHEELQLEPGGREVPESDDCLSVSPPIRLLIALPWFC